MAIRISFADLTHTGQLVAANTFPLGITMVAAYANKVLGDEIEFDIFRYPEEFNTYLEKGLPLIACFSIFSWNMHLAHEHARKLKEIAPQTITIFGGANIPNTSDEQKPFLFKYPAIDFCVEGEGEITFIELYNALKKFRFDAEAFKKSGQKVANTCYVYEDKMVKGDLLPRIMDLEIIPSTFDNGLSDKFFDNHLLPMIQTARGCPYLCTFCHEGAKYFNKTRRVSQERVKYEIEYIAKRAKTPDLFITDLNFGMFPEDIETAQYIATIQSKYGWPKLTHIGTAKNHKTRVLDISKILRGSTQPGGAVQSTNPNVLKEIKRTNLPVEELVEVARTAETDGACSFSEVILCLPGDSKQAHFQSIVDTINAGFALIRTYQFLMLAGTEANTKEYRKKYDMETRFRIKPMNIGTYEFLGEAFSSVEIEEICVANNTMSYDDYRDCRKLSLTVEIFNNNGIFYDIFKFLTLNGVSRSQFLMDIHDQALHSSRKFSNLYQEYTVEEDQNLWTSKQELIDFVNTDGTIERYLSGELGINEIYKYRATALLNYLDEMHGIVFNAAQSLINARSKLNDLTKLYIQELKLFSMMRKFQVFDTDWHASDKFHFDFVKLVGNNFSTDPISTYSEQPVEMTTFHSPQQIDHINGYKKQFGTSQVGLGRILNRAHIGSMYRNVRKSDGSSSFDAFSTKMDSEPSLPTDSPTESSMRSKASIVSSTT